MSTEFKQRRFIAGAVCPKCAEMDKTVMYRVSETEQVRECVRCGFKETIRDDVPLEEPKTRVNQPRAVQRQKFTAQTNPSQASHSSPASQCQRTHCALSASWRSSTAYDRRARPQRPRPDS